MVELTKCKGTKVEPAINIQIVNPKLESSSQQKQVKVIDQTENAKEIQVLARGLHELHKTIKQRAGDVAVLKGFLKDAAAITKDMTVEESINKIIAGESARVKSEDKRITLLEAFSIEDKEAKK